VQKLNKYELRYLINEETQLIHHNVNRTEPLDEGVLDAIENYATSFLGHAVVGDIAAAIKAVGPDALRLVSSMNDLDNLMKEYTGGQIGFIGLVRDPIEGNPESEMALQQISMLPPEDKEEIKESFERYAENVKKIMISIISIFPDVVISGGTSLALSSIPAGKLMLSLASEYADFDESVQRAKSEGKLVGKLGSAALSAFEFVMKRLADPSGVASAIFGNPMVAFKNTGLIARIVMEGEDTQGILKSIAKDSGLVDAGLEIGKDYLLDKTGIDLDNFGVGALDDFDLDMSDLKMVAESRKRTITNQSPSFNEERMLKLAGIK